MLYDYVKNVTYHHFRPIFYSFVPIFFLIFFDILKSNLLVFPQILFSSDTSYPYQILFESRSDSTSTIFGLMLMFYAHLLLYSI